MATMIIFRQRAGWVGFGKVCQLFKLTKPMWTNIARALMIAPVTISCFGS